MADMVPNGNREPGAPPAALRGSYSGSGCRIGWAHCGVKVSNGNREQGAKR